MKQTKCRFFCMDCYISRNLSFSLVIRMYICIGKMLHVVTDLGRSMCGHCTSIAGGHCMGITLQY